MLRVELTSTGHNYSLNSCTVITVDKEDGKSNETDDKKKKKRIPGWKKEAPKEVEPHTIKKGEQEYHWCSKCRQGEGLWALHKTKDHKANYVIRF